MPTADHYRKSAQECRRIAGEAQDSHERETLLRMAAQWERLAEQRPARKRKKGRPPQLVVLPFRPLLTGENLSRMIQVSNFDQTVTG